MLDGRKGGVGEGWEGSRGECWSCRDEIEVSDRREELAYRGEWEAGNELREAVGETEVDGSGTGVVFGKSSPDVGDEVVEVRGAREGDCGPDDRGREDAKGPRNKPKAPCLSASTRGECPSNCGEELRREGEESRRRRVVICAPRISSCALPNEGTACGPRRACCSETAEQ